MFVRRAHSTATRRQVKPKVVAQHRQLATKAKLVGTKTHNNLKAAFAGESQAHMRYLFYSQKADVEGHSDVSTVFRSTAEGAFLLPIDHIEIINCTGFYWEAIIFKKTFSSFSWRRDPSFEFLGKPEVAKFWVCTIC